MRAIDLTPQTFFSFTDGLTSAKQAAQTSFFLATQSAAFQKERGSGDFYLERIRKSGSRAIDASGSLLTKGSGSLFKARAVVSSDAATATATAPNGTPGLDFNIDVKQLAGSQDVLSNRVDAQAANDIGRGFYDFRINDKGQSTRLTVQVRAGDTNEQVLQKAADEINNAGLGLYATIDRSHAPDTTAARGSVQLRISGIMAEDMSSVSIVDEGTKFLQNLGITTKSYATGNNGGIAQQVNDSAIFSINGAAFESDSNNIAVYENSLSYGLHQYNTYPATAASIVDEWEKSGYELANTLRSSDRGGGGLFGAHVATITLKGAGRDAALSVVPDSAAAAEGISSLVSTTSSFSDTLKTKPMYGYNEARTFLNIQFDRFAAQLEDIGITKDNKKYNVESRSKLLDKLNNHFENTTGIFSGPGGLAGKIRFGLSKAIAMPMTGFSIIETANTHSISGLGSILDMSF